MAGDESELWATLREWQTQGHMAALATVIRTFGSSPRPAGSMVLIRDDGAVVGSVSGGCIEQELVARIREHMPRLPRVLRFGGTAEENQRIGLPCGGTLELVWEAAPDPNLVESMCSALQASQAIGRRLDLHSGASSLFAPGLQDTFSCDDTSMVTVLRPHLRLLIIGAVHIARYLAEMASPLGYAVLICDPREEYYSTWKVPGSTLMTGMPDDVVLAIQPDARTAIIALTHDPKLDDMALLEALRSDAFYVGALGSRRNQAKRRERLALLDLAPEHIAKLHGPVGLPIGSRTPAEIAVAILADLIAMRNGIALRAAAPIPSIGVVPA